PSTRAILVNSPSNPTGALNDPQETRALVELAERRGIWIIADECYDQIVFDTTNACVGADLDLESAPVISAFSFSKTYAMTGWRLGYLVASSTLSQHVTRMQAASVASAAMVSQMAGLAALQGPQEPAAEMLSAYRHRRDVATGILDEHGIAYVRPDGALYVFVDIRSSGIDSRDFATGLLRERAVCTTPGI
ncbi:MAG: aminotransferase class I/II-fold pyridoxal phosphate-dependent enzyme, partial [Alphaproteobacteria bacterium]|nr:aminotransferase class I/II-fold pyridoxal phosphate-dependent enzyme [Alphaproteobacteria bacterium]